MKAFLKRLLGLSAPATGVTGRRPLSSSDSFYSAGPTNGLLVADIDAVVMSDLGNRRDNNEDTGLFVRLADEGQRQRKGYLLLVADGMGGHLAGEVASQMAADIISREYFGHSDTIETSLLRAFQLANAQIMAEARLSTTFRGMGTTCTAVVIQQQQLYFAHVGDSRAYLLKAGQLVQLTEDHTYVQELLRSGDITPDQAHTHPDRNVLTQAIGTKANVRIDVGRCVLPFDLGDRLLLCSDGLYEYCPETDLIQSLHSLNSLPDVANNLLQMAKSRGGHDNITVVVAERTPAGPTPVAKETREIDLPVTQILDLPNP